MNTPTREITQAEKFDKHEWYMVFISIIFGVFISVWIEPFAGEVQALFEKVDNEPERFIIIFRAIIMFLILVCLWWWYAMYLAKIAPADGFLMYGYDFITLAFFALGFRFWDNPSLFPWAVLGGAAFMFVRFVLVMDLVGNPSKERTALLIAIFVLGGIMIFLCGAGLMAIFFQSNGGNAELVHNPKFQGAILTLLFIGFVSTLFSVRKVEGGIKWGDPDKFFSASLSESKPKNNAASEK